MISSGRKFVGHVLEVSSLPLRRTPEYQMAPQGHPSKVLLPQIVCEGEEIDCNIRRPREQGEGESVTLRV